MLLELFGDPCSGPPKAKLASQLPSVDEGVGFEAEGEVVLCRASVLFPCQRHCVRGLSGLSQAQGPAVLQDKQVACSLNSGYEWKVF